MPTKFLKTILALDALTCVATGALLAAGAALLAPLLGLPHMLLQEAGLFLLAFAAFAWWASRRVARQSWPARTVMIANLAWVAASIALVAGPWVAPSVLGIVFVAVQAVAVAGLALLQIAGLSKLSPAVA